MSSIRAQSKIIKKKYSQTARGLRETFIRRHETLIRKGMTLNELCDCEVMVIVKHVKTNKVYLYNSLGPDSQVGPNGLPLNKFMESYPPVIVWKPDQLEALMDGDMSEVMGNEDEDDSLSRLMSSSSTRNSSPQASSPEPPSARKPFPAPIEIPMSPLELRGNSIFQQEETPSVRNVSMI